MEIKALTTTDQLPALTGSPKQTAWAEQIRQEFLDEHVLADAEGIDVTYVLRRDRLDALAAEVGPLADQPHLDHATGPEVESAIVTQGSAAQIARGIEAALGQTSAGWWIDHRSGATVAFALRKLARRAGRR